jgi:general secretion pathway protein L
VLPTLARTLSRFLAWWGGELAALVPQGLQQWWRGADGMLLLSFAEDHAIFKKPAAGRLDKILSVDIREDAGAQRLQVGRQLAKAAGKNFRLLLDVPAAAVLRRTLSLPLAVEENLRQTLSFELDRYTPFRTEQVYFDFRVLERDPVRRRLKVELAAIQRPVVDNLAAKASALGLPAVGAVLADQIAGDDGFFNFLPAMAGLVNTSSRLWWRAGLAALATLLLATLLAIPVWQKRTAAISLLEPLAGAKAAAQETDALRDRLDKVVKDYSFLLDMKWGSPSSVLVLEELSKRIPDDTFLAQLDYDGKTLQIQGESASASGLVELLEASPMFKDVGFKAQLTKIQGTSTDRFHIAAILEDDARPKPAPAPDAAVAAAAVAAQAAPVAVAQPTPVSKP